MYLMYTTIYIIDIYTIYIYNVYDVFHVHYVYAYVYIFYTRYVYLCVYFYIIRVQELFLNMENMEENTGYQTSTFLLVVSRVRCNIT